MKSDPHIRRLSDLRAGRFDNSGARYFITCCVKNRRHILIGESARIISEETGLMLAQSVIHDSALIVMPDHIHWLFIAGTSLSLGQIIARLKSKTRAALMTAGAEWQPNYYEHRLRSYESSERYAQYMFLNPYRAELIPVERKWPYWYRPENGRWEFETDLDVNGCPPHRWIGSIGNPMLSE